ncbi:hypothetical protein GV828_07190 [Flavobacterium sp. NST-5]|uniref:Carboxypeptidase regulatory-like domain-containing protein n=1 Tax=Flavobacterium ichthyis TaxID=2698827 RepID=A0ABW9Z7Y0_9FLAO|nr:hypothetical protein [Flavobacterium ichthyis]NBL64982.1 hypothetical protein [Flavobacterium ichthyis]
MKTNLLSSLLLLPFMAFCQTKTIRGKVHYFSTPVEKVEVVNLSSKQIVLTDASGNFSIDASPGDEIGFISKEYDYLVQKIFKDEINNFYTIALKPKPILMDEVVVYQEFTLPGMSYAELGPGPLGQSQTLPSNPFVYNGTTAGINFMEVARMIKKAFPKKEKPAPEYKPPVFKDFVFKNFDDDFFTKDLKIAYKDISTFVDFCNEDPKADESSFFGNKLNVLEFLLKKAEEFKKL